MTFNPSPAELTTGATDALLAAECLVLLVWLRSSPSSDRWKAGLWSWVFGIVAVVSFLGAVAHAFVIADSLRAAIWKPLFVGLLLAVSLFPVGALCDWRGSAEAKRFLPWSVGLGILVLYMAANSRGPFAAFVLYQAATMFVLFVPYAFLAVTRRLRGAGIVAVAILLNVLGAAAQTGSVSFVLLVPFDHNGVFHLVQMVAFATLGIGIRMGSKPALLAGEMETEAAACQPPHGEAQPE